MELPKNAFKAALKAGNRQLGFWNSIPTGTVVEMLAGCGFDWVLIDTEHTAISSSDIIPMLQAAAGYPVSPVVRPAWNDKVEIKKMLDAGAQTLLVPYVQSAEEAQAAVAAVRYPPKGIRGVAGSTRAARYGAVTDYAKHADEEICLLVQVETAEALSQIEEIAAVDGVDGIFIGPADLAASLGHPGNIRHPKVHAAVIDAVKRITAAGKPAGFLSPDAEFNREVAEAGALFVALGIDMVTLRKAVLATRDAWR